jgi:hypothetical protein
MRRFIAAMTISGLFFGIQATTRGEPVATLIVQGAITPPACTPTLDKQVIDLGTIKFADMSATGETGLGSRQFNITITCGTRMGVALKATDNKINTSSNEADDHFGLGYAPDGIRRLGYYYLPLGGHGANGGVIYDGKTGDIATTCDSGGTWFSAVNVTTTCSFGTVEARTDTPVFFTEAIFTLHINPVIAQRDASHLTLSEDAPLDGSVTFSIEYL